MQLDERLGLAYDLYEDCDLAADIGTDHGYLPLALLRSGKCRRMILTDVSPDALDNARSHLSMTRMGDRAELRVGWGMEPIGEACGMISILGMGGRIIQEILEKGQERLRGAKLLLSPHTEPHQVRYAVMTIGYHLEKEIPCRAAGRLYLMMVAAPGAESLTQEEMRRGRRLMESGSPLLTDYLAQRLKWTESQISGLQTARKKMYQGYQEALDRAEADAAYYREMMEAADQKDQKV